MSEGVTRQGRSRRQTYVLVCLLIVAAVAAIIFAMRTYRSYRAFQVNRAIDAGDTGAIRPWMTLRFVSHRYHVSEPDLAARLGLPADLDPKTTLATLARRKGQPVREFLGEVRLAVGDLRQQSPAQPPGGPPQPGSAPEGGHPTGRPPGGAP